MKRQKETDGGEGVAVKDIDTKIDTMTNAKRYKQKDKEKGDRGRDKDTQRQTQKTGKQ